VGSIDEAQPAGMTRNVIAIIGIFLCTTLGWIILGATIEIVWRFLVVSYLRVAIGPRFAYAEAG
jgi:hypothetical protein